MRIKTGLVLFILVLGSRSMANPAPVDDETAIRIAHSGKLIEKSAGNTAVWEKLIDLTIKTKDATLLHAILRIPAPENGMPAEVYRNDLFRILGANPVFFIHAATAEFKGNMDCTLRWLVNRHSQSIPFATLRDGLEGALKTLSGEGKEEASQYLRRSKEIYQALIDDEDVIDSSGCA